MTTDERICATVGSLVIENARLLSQVADLEAQLYQLRPPQAPDEPGGDVPSPPYPPS